MQRGLTLRAWALASVAIAMGATLAMFGPISAAIGWERPSLNLKEAYLLKDGAVRLSFFAAPCENDEDKTITATITLVQTIERQITSRGTNTVTFHCGQGDMVDTTISSSTEKAFSAGEARLYIDNVSQDPLITIGPPRPDPPKK